jgi:hypothetical protein
MALSTEPRIGLFVVARLAARHGIAVTLRESAYGGTRAIVLVKSDLLGVIAEPVEEPPAEDTTIERQERHSRHRTEPPAPLAVPDLPPLPEASTPMSMFQPQHSVRSQPPVWPGEDPAATPPPPSRTPQSPRQPQRPRPPEARPSQPRGPEAPGRPPLPQRRKQQNLVPQLMEDRPSLGREEARAETPEQARSRVSAFQQGTRRAREHESTGSDDTDGDRTS